MLVKQNRKQTSHTEPVYFVDFDGVTLTTNTQTSGNETGPDGFPVQYRQTINAETGACTCGCQGFQDSVTRKARAANEVPAIHNGYTCKHIRKAQACGEEWGYLDSIHDAPAVEAETSGEVVSNFDYYAFFESA